MLQQKLLETGYESPLATPKAKGAVVTPPTGTQSETDLDEESRRRRKCHKDCYVKRSQISRSICPMGDDHGTQIRKAQKETDMEESEGISLKAEAVNGYKLKDLSKSSCKSKKLENSRPGNDRYSTALYCNIY